jgi:hypothetical protein
MPSMVARSFQFIPAETFQSSPFTFIPKQELEDQSEAKTSDQEEISMRFPDSVEIFEPVRKSTPLSPPPSKPTALLRMKMKFMRARHQLRQAEDENKHLKHYQEQVLKDYTKFGNYPAMDANRG